MKKVDYPKIYNILIKHVDDYHVPVIDLMKTQGADPFRILIGTILSARTKDETTSKVGEKLFKKIKNFEDIRKIKQSDLEKLVYPVGFYKTKAANLKKLGLIMLNQKDIIPKKIEDLIKLPGVGRKTANLVVNIAFDDYGICVDTHVHRIMNRFGYIKTKNPFETEIKLREILPKKYWKGTNRILVAFGQNLCTPISPHCSQCPVVNYCNRVEVIKSR